MSNDQIAILAALIIGVGVAGIWWSNHLKAEKHKQVPIPEMTPTDRDNAALAQDDKPTASTPPTRKV